MLQLLHIENVAVIEKADIEFDPGLNVLTGETGAGKSIVIDALGAVLGGRVSKELVRTGAANALITASFTGNSGARWCLENGIDCEDEEIFLTRRIGADGKNTCRINGCPVPVAQLRALGQQLLDVHGQNDGQKLLDDQFHRSYLDNFAMLENAVSEYQNIYYHYKEIQREIREIETDEKEKEWKIDTLHRQIQEIENANIKPGEQEEKMERRDLLRNSGKLITAIDGAFDAMYGSDQSDGAVALIAQAEGELHTASRYSEALVVLTQKLEELRYQAEDAAEQLREFRGQLDFSPEEYDALENRLDLLNRLSRKYGPKEEDILANLKLFQDELEQIEYSAERQEKLNRELVKVISAAENAAKNLTEKRKMAAKELEIQIKEELSQLSMKGVTFKVEFEKVELCGMGQDEVHFLMSANIGEKPGRISKIASGGELARIMLAMKNVLAKNDPIETMVFDEIDTGVSGIAAQRVGEKLAALAQNRQVICVTHLPQIAAMADSHYAIAKYNQGARTFTRVEKLKTEGRKHELSRLSGGENVTDASLLSAAEQLEAAAVYKRNCLDGKA